MVVLSLSNRSSHSSSGVRALVSRSGVSVGPGTANCSQDLAAVFAVSWTPPPQDGHHPEGIVIYVGEPL